MSEGKLNLSKSGHIYQFADKFYSWLWKVGENSANLAGHVVGVDWIPKSEPSLTTNSTNVTNSSR